MKYLFWGIFFLTLFSARKKQIHIAENSWNPDAGIIESYTENATVISSSNQEEAHKIIDKKNETHWQSEAPLPLGFVTRNDQNILLNRTEIFATLENCDHLQKMVDGDLNTISNIKQSEGKAEITLDFNQKQTFFSISIKCQVRATLELIGITNMGQTIEIGRYEPNDNFQFKRFQDLNLQLTNLIIRSTQSFDVFEIAALSALPKEFVIIDLGKNQAIGTVYSKHWAGESTAKTTQIFLSQNGQNWQLAAELNPASISNIITNINPAQPAQFLKIEHTLFAKDWNKVSIWEVRIFDQNGHYGARPDAQPSTVSISELLGVNGYWGWGRKMYSDMLKEGEGPSLFSPISSHARNYHDLTWDLNSPDETIDFEAMKNGRGTPAKEWLNWDKEYKTWSATGMNIQVSIQFFRFKDSDWKSPFESAHQYGKSFAQHFGISKGNGYVCTMEVGNEPWKYDAEIYQKILLGMAKGAKEGDPKMEVFPCALQAADPEMEESGIFKNYIGARISERHLPYLDGINIHAYSYKTNFWGQRQGTFPENPNSTFWEILNAIRWRDHNMPGKKIYLSEWGWDSSGGGENCTHDVCVSERAAAAYAVRGLVIAQRLGLDRATWYFYANSEPQSSLYTRSGLTGTAETDFKKKQVFHALEKLIQTIGNQYFIKKIQENTNAWIYLMGDQYGTPTHLIGWRPISGDDQEVLIQNIKTPYRPKNVISLDENSPRLPKYENGYMTLELNSMPQIIELEVR